MRKTQHVSLYVSVPCFCNLTYVDVPVNPSKKRIDEELRNLRRGKHLKQHGKGVLGNHQDRQGLIIGEVKKIRGPYPIVREGEVVEQ